MKEIMGYRCEYCGKVYLKKAACHIHETTRCNRNPFIRPYCYSCQHYHKAQWDDVENIVWRSDDSEWHRENYKKFTVNRCKHPENERKLFNKVNLSSEMKEGLHKADFKEMPTKQSGGCKFYQEIDGYYFPEENMPQGRHGQIGLESASYFRITGKIYEILKRN